MMFENCHLLNVFNRVHEWLKDAVIAVLLMPFLKCLDILLKDNEVSLKTGNCPKGNHTFFHLAQGHNRNTGL